MDYSKVIKIFLRLKYKEIYNSAFVEVLVNFATMLGIVAGGSVAWVFLLCGLGYGYYSLFGFPEKYNSGNLLNAGGGSFLIITTVFLIGFGVVKFCKWITSNWQEANRIALLPEDEQKRRI